MPNSVEEPVQQVGGWINHYHGEQQAYELDPETYGDLDEGRLNYFERYIDEYFNGPFVYGWGTEVILDMTARFHKPGRWLDIGAGTTTLFWSIPMTGILDVTCCDLVPEALIVLDRFRTSDRVPTCYTDVLKMYGKTPAYLANVRGLPWRYLVFDTMTPWPKHLLPTFDMITPYGNFGLAPDEETYVSCFRNLATSLSPQGHVIGADWQRKAHFVADEGLDNRYVNEDLVTAAAASAGLTILACEKVPLKDDPLYDSLVAYALSAA